MSRRTTCKVTCEGCGHEQQFTAWVSVNATSDPKLKEDLLAGRLATFVCEACGKQRDVVYDMVYHDMDQQVMVRLRSGNRQGASEEVGDALEGYRYRLVRSRNELVEKILIFDAGLDDRIVELLKLAVVRRMALGGAARVQAYFSELLDRADGDRRVAFVVMTGQATKAYSVPWSAYEQTSAACESMLPAPPQGADRWLRVDQEYVRSFLGP